MDANSNSVPLQEAPRYTCMWGYPLLERIDLLHQQLQNLVRLFVRKEIKDENHAEDSYSFFFGSTKS